VFRRDAQVLTHLLNFNYSSKIFNAKTATQATFWPNYFPKIARHGQKWLFGRGRMRFTFILVKINLNIPLVVANEKIRLERLLRVTVLISIILLL